MLLENRVARVFIAPGGGLSACERGTSDLIPLALPKAFFSPPALALRGDVVGMASVDENGELSVSAIQLRPQGFVYGRPRAVVRVGSLRVTQAGDMVWIECPPGNRTDGDTGFPSVNQRPSCVRPGHWIDRVIVLAHRPYRLVELDRGRGIDPRSLRLRGRTFTWRHHGRRRSYVDMAGQ